MTFLKNSLILFSQELETLDEFPKKVLIKKEIIILELRNILFFQKFHKMML